MGKAQRLKSRAEFKAEMAIYRQIDILADRAWSLSGGDQAAYVALLAGDRDYHDLCTRVEPITLRARLYVTETNQLEMRES